MRWHEKLITRRALTVIVCGLAFLFCGRVVAQSTAAAKPAGNKSALSDRVKALAMPYIENDMVAGMSIGVIKGGERASAHVGVANTAGAPNDDTIYEIGSVSKVFTGIMLADAIVQEKVKLDQPAQELLPDGVKMPSRSDQPITLKNISTHRSGLPRLSDNMPSVTGSNPYSDYTSELAYAFLNEHQLQREPGEKYEYSNFAVSLLGKLLAERVGKSYDELLQERLAQPLGMKETRVEMTQAMRRRLATPHGAGGGASNTWEFADMPGAGGIRSSIKDMIRFAAANISPPKDELGRALNLAWQEHEKARPGEMAMGLGWHIAQDGSTRWHNGQTGGYHSMLMVNRQAKIAVVILANSAVEDVDTLAAQIIQMLAGAQVQPRKFDKAVKVAPQVMKQYEGRYQLAPGFVFTVTVKGGKLMVGVTNQPTLEVYPKSETEWFYKVVDATLTFKKDSRGKVTSLELFQNGVRQTAKKIE